MNDIDVKSLLLKISQAIDAQSSQSISYAPTTPLDTPTPVSADHTHGDNTRLIVENPWTAERYSWGEEISTNSFSIPYACISTEYKHLSHAARSLRLITLFLAYGPEGKKGVIELKKSHIREAYNFDTRTLERAIYELREAGFLVEIGRERNLRNKPMRYFVMVPTECFGPKAARFNHITPHTPRISPPPVPETESASPVMTKNRFPSVFDYKEAKELVQSFYRMIAKDIPDPGKLLNETLLASEMIRFYGKHKVEASLKHLPAYPPFQTTQPKSFRWFSSCIENIQEHLKKDKPPASLSSSPPPPSSSHPSLPQTSDESQKKKLYWIRFSEAQQLEIKEKVLELYPFIKNEDVLETIAQEMAYQTQGVSPSRI